MIFLDETSSRADLEAAAIEAGFCDTAEACAAIEAMTDADLLAKLAAWIEEGDETAAV